MMACAVSQADAVLFACRMVVCCPVTVCRSMLRQTAGSFNYPVIFKNTKHHYL